MKTATLTLLLLLAFAGCGGDPETYALEPTRSCLAGHGIGTSTDPDDLDAIASSSSEAAAATNLPSDTELMIVVNRNADDAERTEAAYAMFYEGLGASADGVLERKGNVVLSWSETPPDEERDRIGDCLSR